LHEHVKKEKKKKKKKEREFNLQTGISKCSRNPKILDHERELKAKNNELVDLVRSMRFLEAEKMSFFGADFNFNFDFGKA
jgi:hypothetical protein